MIQTIPSYTDIERARAAGWKRSTTDLPDEARAAAPYVGPTGVAHGRAHDFCLPPQFADHNLLPDVRTLALDLFEELDIRWHNGVGDGPSNHLLSSQVQCVNALGLMVEDPDRICRAFEDVLGTDIVEPIEPGRFLTFEYIGDTDFFGESPDGPRTRGAHCTSVDAAFLHKTHAGIRELILLEWKFTESYRPRRPDPARDKIRWARYGEALTDPGGPIRSDVLPFDDLCQEPFYQLVRQQLLALELEQTHAHGVDRVRVVHVTPAGNLEYQSSLTPGHRSVGPSVSAVWSKLLRHEDRFVYVDSAIFLDHDVTSWDYDARYGDYLAWDLDELYRIVDDEIEEFLYAGVEFEGDVEVSEDGVKMTLCGNSTLLEFPFNIAEFWDVDADLEERAEGEGT